MIDDRSHKVLIKKQAECEDPDRVRRDLEWEQITFDELLRRYQEDLCWKEFYAEKKPPGEIEREEEEMWALYEESQKAEEENIQKIAEQQCKDFEKEDEQYGMQ